MKTVLEYTSLIMIAIMIMPFLVEPTPLTLWLSSDHRPPQRIGQTGGGAQ